jgi:phosphoribosylanthranilate isomerase
VLRQIAVNALLAFGMTTVILGAGIDLSVGSVLAFSGALSAGLAVAGWPPEVWTLLDAHDSARRGGTGRAIDWDVAAEVSRMRRIILAGGLDASNVHHAIARVHPFAVDVSSGVEREPGVKDPHRLRAFVERVAAADAARLP